MSPASCLVHKYVKKPESTIKKFTFEVLIYAIKSKSYKKQFCATGYESGDKNQEIKQYFEWKKTRRTFANFSEPLLSLRKRYLVLNFWRERRSSWSLILFMSILNMNISCKYDLSSYFCWLCFVGCAEGRVFWTCPWLYLQYIHYNLLLGGCFFLMYANFFCLYLFGFCQCHYSDTAFANAWLGLRKPLINAANVNEHHIRCDSVIKSRIFNKYV